jgi:hypothetical protein
MSPDSVSYRRHPSSAHRSHRCIETGKQNMWKQHRPCCGWSLAVAALLALLADTPGAGAGDRARGAGGENLSTIAQSYGYA